MQFARLVVPHKYKSPPHSTTRRRPVALTPSRPCPANIISSPHCPPHISTALQFQQSTCLEKVASTSPRQRIVHSDHSRTSVGPKIQFSGTHRLIFVHHYDSVAYIRSPCARALLLPRCCSQTTTVLRFYFFLPRVALAHGAVRIDSVNHKALLDSGPSPSLEADSRVFIWIKGTSATSLVSRRQTWPYELVFVTRFRDGLEESRVCNLTPEIAIFGRLKYSRSLYAIAIQQSSTRGTSLSWPGGPDLNGAPGDTVSVRSSRSRRPGEALDILCSKRLSKPRRPWSKRHSASFRLHCAGKLDLAQHQPWGLQRRVRLPHPARQGKSFAVIKLDR